jgi:energy-coupling factor transporter ATP-binding protein EcfA2/ABC-type multidrug transport system permease subunit
MHAQLTVREALYFTARLRTDLSDAEIAKRIDEVLGELDIRDIVDREIGSPEKKVLSGGQRKRVNVAMELLSQPDVIFLDEPTSGLSSYDAEQVISLLRKLADAGKTIIATIHQPSLKIYQEFDNLIMVSRDKGDNPGVLAYYGPAYPQSIEFFDPEGSRRAQAESKELSPEMLLTGLTRQPSDSWSRKYDGSQHKRQFVSERAGKTPPAAGGAQQSKAVRTFGFGQWMTLVRRNLILKSRDRMQTFLMVVQAPLFAILLALSFQPENVSTFESLAEWGKFSGRLGTVHFFMVVAVLWFGCNNAARDIVGEWAVYTRERMVNLKIPSYVMSKMTVLGLLCAFQCLVLLTIVYFACGLKAPFLGTYLILLLASAVGCSIGLLISAATKTTEAAIMLLPIVLLPMIIFGGGVKPIHEMKPMDKVAQLIPSRWAFEANFVQEAKHRRETLIPKDCADALSKQGEACNAQLARLPGQPQLPAPEFQAAGTDVAEGAFPRANRGRTPLSQIIAILAGMAVLLNLAVLGTLRRRDIR